MLRTEYFFNSTCIGTYNINKLSNDRESVIILNDKITGNVHIGIIVNCDDYRDKKTEVKIVVLEGRHETKQLLENES